MCLNKKLASLGCFLTAGLLGILLTFAFAPYGIFPLASIAPAGLLALWLSNNQSLRKTFWLGYAFGLGLFGAGVYWIFTSIHVFGGVSVFFALLITSGMIAILALFPATVGYLTNRYFPINNTQKLVYAFPAIWVFSEWVRAWFFSGFPWLFLGYSQTNSPLKGYAPILSVYLISLALTMSSGLLVNMVLLYKQKAWRALSYNFFALSLIWLLGGVLSYIPWTKPQGQPLAVALVQGNIPQSVKWSSEYAQLSLDRYTELTQTLWDKNTLIIWPEAAIPIPLQETEAFINALDQKAKDNHTNLILGIPVQTEKGYYNTLVTLGEGNNQVYKKRHLVPFGEYVPFSNFFANAFQFLDVPMSEMVSGKMTQAPFLIHNLKILPSICYEIAFPELTRVTDKSINLLLVVTNDAWFGASNAQAQHLQMAAMRALEFRKPVLFVSNDGITAIINANGQIEKALAQKQALVLSAKVQPRYGLTPWLKNGCDPLYFILFYLVYLAYRANKLAIKTSSMNQTKDLSHPIL